MKNTDCFEAFNCEMIFKCPKNRHSMQITDNTEIGKCQECKKDVHFVRTKDAAQKFAADEKCVAFYEFTKFTDASKILTRTMGIIAPPNR